MTSRSRRWNGNDLEITPTISEPALSQQIGNLLGLKLFDRNSRRVELTEGTSHKGRVLTLDIQMSSDCAELFS